MLSLPAYALPRGRRVPSHGATRAFTLIELLMVIALIGILAAITLGVVRGVKERAAIGQAKAELAVLATALESYKRHFGDYPQIKTPEGDATRLYQSLLGELGPGGSSSGKWKKTFIEAGKLTLAQTDSPATDNYIVDPWGKAYYYTYFDLGTGTNIRHSYMLYSSGPDGEHTRPENGQIDESAAGNADNIYANR